MAKLVILLPKLTAGGTERTAAELANYLVQKGYEVTVLLMYNQPIFYTVDSKVSILMPNEKYRTQFGRIFYIPYLLWFIRNNIKRIQPDTVFCLGYILFGLVALLKLNTKVVISNRTSPFRVRFPQNKMANFAYKLSYRLFASRVDGIIAQTKIAKEVFEKQFRCSIEVIPNFLRPMNYFKQEKENIILTIGRCVPEKGQKYFIDFVSRIKQDNYRYYLIGDGPELESLKKYAKELNVYHKIEFIGFTKEVDQYLSRSKILIFTSLHEGYPNTIIEAMAQGCVPISFNCVAGPSDIIQHGENGFLTELGDVDSVVEHAKQLITNDALFSSMSFHSKQIIHRNDINVLGAKYEHFLFNAIIENSSN